MEILVFLYHAWVYTEGYVVSYSCAVVLSRIYMCVFNRLYSVKRVLKILSACVMN